MKRSKVIALSAICSAFAIIFMTVGAFVPVFDYSAIFMASMCTMVPLAKKSWTGGLMTGMATVALSFIFFFGTNPAMVVTYAIFFSAHPTVSWLLKEKKLNKVLAMAIKAVWFVGALLLIYLLFSSFLFESSILNNETFKKYAYLVLAVGGVILFVVYDLIMTYFQTAIDKTIEKLKI
ncbi:MAG: hypothetical protein IKA61_05340 [Clostridia bacterium]|nr:hypothetical protein [Clostridia bacterium]